MIQLTNPDFVKMSCTAKNEVTNETWKFKNFLLVGLKEEGGETIIVAADLRDFARALDQLIRVYKTSLTMASPQTRREVEADLIIEAIEGHYEEEAEDEDSEDED